MLKHMEKELMYSTERFFSACTVLPFAKNRTFLAYVGNLVCKIQMVIVDMLQRFCMVVMYLDSETIFCCLPFLDLLYMFLKSNQQGRRKVWKSKGAWITAVGIICPPGWDRVNCLAKNWGGLKPPPSPPTCDGPEVRTILITKYHSSHLLAFSENLNFKRKTPFLLSCP